MSDEQKYTIQGLDEYIRQGEPQQCSGWDDEDAELREYV